MVLVFITILVLGILGYKQHKELLVIKKVCEEFSFKCIKGGSVLRKEFLAKLETEKFSDIDANVSWKGVIFWIKGQQKVIPPRKR
jgi:hypothetical protein